MFGWTDQRKQSGANVVKFCFHKRFERAWADDVAYKCWQARIDRKTSQRLYSNAMEIEVRSASIYVSLLLSCTRPLTGRGGGNV